MLNIPSPPSSHPTRELAIQAWTKLRTFGSATLVWCQEEAFKRHRVGCHSSGHSVLFAVRVAANEACKINEAIKKSGLSKPEWARNALIRAAEF